MLGIFSRSWARRSHGSSLRNRIDGVEGRAAPHLDREDPAGRAGRRHRPRGACRGSGRGSPAATGGRRGRSCRSGAAASARGPSARTPRRPSFWKSWREPSADGRASCVERGGSGSARCRIPRGRVDAGEAVDGHLGGVASGASVARSWRTGNRNSSGVSSMNRVVQPPCEELGVRDHVEQERDVRLHAPDAELLQRPLHPP